MDRRKRIIIFAIPAVAAIFHAGVIAAPTSQPVVAIPADWQAQDHAAAGITLSVPPVWKAGSHTDESVSFLLPTSARMSEDKVLIEMHPMKDVLLTKAVADAKLKIQSEGASTKLVRDAADTLDDQPAWVLLSEKTYTNALAEAAKPAAKPVPAKPVARKLRTYQQLCVADGKLFVLTFAADSATYDQQFPNFKKVLASCRIAGPATAPTEVSSPAEPVAPVGWTTVSRADAHFNISVPSTWKKTTDEPAKLSFKLPRQQGVPGGDDLTLSFGSCPALSLKQMADQYRPNTAKDPNLKLELDEPTTLGGRPAWLFVCKNVHEFRGVGGAPATSREGKFLQVLTIDKDWQFLMTLDMDHAAVSQDLPVMKQVVEKFKWTAPPRDPALAATQPS